MRRRFLLGLMISALLSGQALGADAPIFVPQGDSWTSALRADFYSRDQGSKMMPLVWLQALKQPTASRSSPTASPATAICPTLANSERAAGRLHGVRSGRSASGRHDLRRLPYAADRRRRQDLPDRRRPGDRRFPELPRRSRYRRRAVLASDAAFRTFRRAVLGSTR